MNKQTLNAVTNAFISIVQDISQGVIVSQILDINCDSSDRQISCNNCISQTNNYYNNTKIDINDRNKIIKDFCSPVCECNINNINMSMSVSLNLSALQSSDSKTRFIDTVKNNMFISAKKSGTDFYFNDDGDDKIKNINKNIENMYNNLISTSFQSTIQELSTLQLVQLKGSGINSINMDQCTSLIETSIQSNLSTNQSLTELQKSMIELTVQVVDSGFAQIIIIIVQIVILLLIIICLSYFMNLGFTFLSLYSTS